MQLSESEKEGSYVAEWKPGMMDIFEVQCTALLWRQTGYMVNNNGIPGGFSPRKIGSRFRILILPVYIFLFLYYRTKFAYFILKMVKKKDKPVAIKILRDISTVAERYMGGVFITGIL
ncbi:MAG: hypothetical protein U5K32_04215 [Bacteroidales bacterium]|nr:hypothetical protein [Bacteroidales bacterium]